ncbi:MAG: L,D-transpeptidase [Eubacterium sp.]|nr:L,D-transpeptidase [Eubacterium sp.]
MVSQKWESHVKYWMAFRGKDYGFHDADWRSGFGGQIYSHNGSHGCINMPTEAAGKLYKWLESDRIGGKAKAWVYYSDGNEFEKKEKNP